MEPELEQATYKEVLLALFAVFYLLPSAISFLAGLSESKDKDSSCEKPLTRIECIYPAYRLGCWMGQPVSSEK